MLKKLSILLLLFVIFTYTNNARAEKNYSSVTLFKSNNIKNKAIININLKKGWKTYWRTSGETGLPPVFDWSRSSNLKSVEVKFPAPIRFKYADIDNFGYEENVSFPVVITPINPSQKVSLKLKLDILLCNNLCIPETHYISTTVPITKHQLKNAFNLLPTNNIEFSKIWFDTNGDTIFFNTIINSKNKFSKQTDMFVENKEYINFDKPIIKGSHFKSKVNFKGSLDEINTLLSGSNAVITITDKDKSFEKNIIIKKPITNKNLSFYIIVIAFIGGLILNLMPCVLPMLSIKIMSILKYNEASSKNIFKDFITTSFGIIFSFWLIAAMLIFLKSAGHTIGWGIQFQNPVFLIFLMLVILLFAANMWGLFEIKLPLVLTSKTPTTSFTTGMFATLLATPCSAPFLGTAISFALASTTFNIFIIFTFLGLGMAVPYILLAVNPNVFKYLPKPGRWMLVLKKFLGLILILTAVWLFSVLLAIYKPATIDDGWQFFDESLIAPAIKNNQIVIVDVTAKWCLTCQANKKFVLESENIRKAFKKYKVLKLQADWTNKNEIVTRYLQSNNKYGVPFNIIYGPKAKKGVILNEILTKKSILDILKKLNLKTP